MTDRKTHDLAEIERLLATRQQLSAWLERLDAGGATAPEAVRAKVRGDYRARLAQVVDSLRAHAGLIGSALEGLRAKARELQQIRDEEVEVRAEAELRHSVGEYSDDDWQLVELESTGKIGGWEAEIERLNREAASLEEVQAQITAAPVRVAPPRAAAPAPEPELIVTHGSDPTPGPEAPAPRAGEPPMLSLVRDEKPEEEIAAAPLPRPEAPRFVPRGGVPRPRESAPARSILFPQGGAAATGSAPQDELAFIRSVTVDPGTATQATPASALPLPVEREERKGSVSSKTLKCSECGSLNRPTEWYCERCGAELAAL